METPKNILNFAASLSFQLKLDTSQKIRGSQFYYQENMISRRFVFLHYHWTSLSIFGKIHRLRITQEHLILKFYTS